MPDRVRRVSDVQALRALAHPLRLRILGALRSGGPATASTLGRRLGESSGATSYHCRQLERHGFVEERPGEGTRRERWWQAVDRVTGWELGTDEPAELEAGLALTAQVVQLHAAWAESWLDELPKWPPAWRSAAGLHDRLVRLTPEALRALTADLDAVIAGYEDGDHGEDAQTVVVAIHAFPARAVR